MIQKQKWKVKMKILMTIKNKKLTNFKWENKAVRYFRLIAYLIINNKLINKILLILKE